MSFLTLVFSCILLAATFSTVRSQQAVINVYINSSVSSDSNCKIPPTIPVGSTVTVTCRTLMEALLKLSNSSNSNNNNYFAIQFNIPKGKHEINDKLTFQNFVEVDFIGNDPQIECTPNGTGLSFSQVTRVIMKNITFLKCSAIRQSTSRIKNKSTTYNFSVSLYFFSSQLVSINNVTVIVSTGVAGVVLYNINTVDIEYSTFITIAENDSSVTLGGGGVVIELTECSPGDVTCLNPIQPITQAQHTIYNCYFMDNIATYLYETNYNSAYEEMAVGRIPSGRDYNSFGKGGGLSLIIKGNSNINIFNISNCTFHQNKAHYGAGVFMSFLDSSFANSVLIQNSTFGGNMFLSNNPTNSIGGGVNIENFANIYNVVFSQNHFECNEAHVGGGISVIHLTNQQLSVSITNNKFTRNMAKFGSALHMHHFVTLNTGFSSTISLQNCLFDSNFIPYRQDSQSGVGTVYSNQLNINFLSEVTFSNNQGTALALVGAIANFSNCIASFVNNTGTRGGAIALLGAAYIEINEGTVLNFVENVALYQGGAIFNRYLEQDSAIQYANCFMKHLNSNLDPNNWGASITFSKNKVLYGENNSYSIHSTSILPCMEQGRALCWNKWKYDDDIIDCNMTKYITTDFKDIEATPYVKSAIPGWPIQFQIKLESDLQQDISDVPQIFLMQTKCGQGDDKVSAFSKDLLTVTGNVDENIDVCLESLGEKSLHLEFNVTLMNCPPGFVFDNTENKCICHQAYSFDGSVKCHRDLGVAAIMGYTWIGQLSENDTNYYVGYCPMHYCSVPSSNFQFLTNSSAGLNDIICKESRQGILCGECKPGYGPAVNSWTYDCVHCDEAKLNINIIKYILLVYTPFAIMLLFIGMFKLKLTAGSANAFILFSQMITTTFDLNAHGNIPLKETSHVLNSYRLPYGIFNLDFLDKIIENFCFTASFNTLSVLLLNYALFIVPIMVVIVIYLCTKILKCQAFKIFCHKHKRLFWFLDDSPEELFILFVATVCLLSYTKLGIISSKILGREHLIDVNNTPTLHKRVYFAGQWSTKEKSYHYYIIPATISEIYMIFFILLLLQYPLYFAERLIKKFRLTERIYPMRKVHIFINTFQSSFKGSFRYFAGLYFLFRFAISILYTSNFTLLTKYIVQEVMSIIMIVLLVICKPYKESVHNFIDILMFTNLALLNGLSFYQYAYYRLTPHSNASTTVFAFQYCLVFVPIVSLLVYLIIRSTKSYHQCITNHMLKILSGLLKKWSSPLHEKVFSTTQMSDSYPSMTRASMLNRGDSNLRNQPESSREIALVEEEASNTFDDIPVDICDKGMGIASTSSEGYYLRSEWSSGCSDYGSIRNSGKKTLK